MAENNGNAAPPSSTDGGEGEGAQRQNNELSLEQALLAPLNSILKAQLHSARSFLNLLLQLGYPPEDQQVKGHQPGEPFHLSFKHYDEDGREQTLRVPALSLVPIAPLAVNSANFELEMAVNRVVGMQQMQRERKDAAEDTDDHRPWFLIDKPVSLEGSIAPSTSGESQQRHETQSSVKIKIDVKSIPMPSGLDKLLTTLTHMGEVRESGDDGDDDPHAEQQSESASDTDPDDPDTGQ